MYALTDGRNYIGVDGENFAISVNGVNKAILFSEEKKANNYKDNLRSTLKRFNWRVVKIEDDINTDLEEESIEEECILLA